MSVLDARVRPLPYDPSFETLEAGEAETSAALRDEMRKILETTSKDYGHAVRSVHAKSHGLLVGELQVLDGLPEELRQGIFARPTTYPTVLRFSTNPGDLLDDSVSVPRGLALKIVGVEGTRLPGSENDTTQDFVLVNGPAFSAKNAAAFLKNLKLLVATTDRGEGLKKVASAVLRGAETLVEAVGGESPTLKTLGGHPNTHILGETFHTQVPVLYGRYVAKISVAPVSQALRALEDEPIKVVGRPNALRDLVRTYFETQSAEWEVRVQLLTNRETMPVEDASVVWPEDESPHIPVARLRVARQDAWSEQRAVKIEDGMAFSPWHGIAEHRPLGSIMRVRRPSYEMSAAFRARFNGCPIREPRDRAEIGV